VNRVAITGIGTVTAVGIGADATWKALLAGRSGIAPISEYDPSALRTRQAAEIPAFDPLDYVPNKRALRMMTRADQLALAGATLAARDAGFDTAAHDPERVGLFLGGNKETSDPDKMADGILAARREDGTADMGLMGSEGAARFYPLYFIEGLQAAALFHISQAFGMKGANTYFHGTADAGATAIGRAFRAVRRGEADVAFAGGFDDATSWWSMSKFDGLGVLSDRNALGPEAFRPYDRDRSGSLLGEGAAFVLLEDLESARRRGAPIYAELAGVGSGFDTSSLLTPHPDGIALRGAIDAALRDAGAAPDDVDYVATHGCATVLGDASEARALRGAFGHHADRLAASSIKPATGHLIAGAGALNVAVAALAVDSGIVPPTLHLEDPDPACDLDWVPREAREQPVGFALALARGLEGQNVVLALRHADRPPGGTR
jgi:3-oxoacyl-[acyl-carrier-protein] synthase II